MLPVGVVRPLAVMLIIPAEIGPPLGIAALTLGKVVSLAVEPTVGEVRGRVFRHPHVHLVDPAKNCHAGAGEQHLPEHKARLGRPFHPDRFGSALGLPGSEDFVAERGKGVRGERRESCGGEEVEILLLGYRRDIPSATLVALEQNQQVVADPAQGVEVTEALRRASSPITGPSAWRNAESAEVVARTSFLRDSSMSS